MESVKDVVMSGFNLVPSSVWMIGLAALYWIFNLYSNQENMLYHPVIPGIPYKRTADNPPPYNSPSNPPWNLAYEDVYITSPIDSISIHAWFIFAPVEVDYKSAATLVFFHANAGNIGFRLQMAQALVEGLKCNLLMVDYRGYGNSDDVKPSERGLELDADAAIAWLDQRSDIDKRKVFVIGQSLGGAVAVRTAVFHSHRIAGLVLENTFTSVPDMVDHLMPFLKHLKRFILRMKWASIDIIHRVDVPILFISGLKDELVPPSMMRRLHDAAVNSEEREIYTVADGGHNDTLLKAGQEYITRLQAFILRVLKRKLGSDDAAGPRVLTEDERKIEIVRRQKAAAAQRTAGLGAGAAVGAVPVPAAAGDVAPQAVAARVHLTGEQVPVEQEGAEELKVEEARDAAEIRSRQASTEGSHAR